MLTADLPQVAVTRARLSLSALHVRPPRDARSRASDALCERGVAEREATDLSVSLRGGARRTVLVEEYVLLVHLGELAAAVRAALELLLCS